MTTWTSLTLIAAGLTGEGDVAFTNAYHGAVILATTIPAFQGSEAGSPAYYRRLGWVGFTTDTYHDQRHILHYANDQITDVPPLVDHLHYKLDLDVVASIYGAKGGSLVDDIYRTFTHVQKEYLATIAPAGSTQRWTYTVPAGKVSRVLLLQAAAQRVTAAGTSGQIYAYIHITGGSNLLVVPLLNNAVGALAEQVATPNLLLNAGDQLEGYSWDASTTGTVLFSIIAAIREMTV